MACAALLLAAAGSDHLLGLSGSRYRLRLVLGQKQPEAIGWRHHPIKEPLRDLVSQQALGIRHETRVRQGTLARVATDGLPPGYSGLNRFGFPQNPFWGR